MRNILGIIFLIILLSPYLFFFIREIYYYFKNKYEKSIKYLYYKGIYSLMYWFIGIIPFLIVSPDFDNLPDNKVNYYGMLFIPLFFIIDLAIVLSIRKKYNQMDKESDDAFDIQDLVGGKNPSLIITILLNISYLIDYLLIFMTIFGVVYGK